MKPNRELPAMLPPDDERPKFFESGAPCNASHKLERLRERAMDRLPHEILAWVLATNKEVCHATGTRTTAA